METSGPARPLWDHIKEVCAERGWSWTRLERESGVTRKTIANWRTQPREPQAASVNAVADALNIDRTKALQLAGILTRDDTEESGESVAYAELAAEVAELKRLNAEQEARNAEQEERDAEHSRVEAELRRRIEELTARQSPAKPADETTGDGAASESGRQAM